MPSERRVHSPPSSRSFQMLAAVHTMQQTSLLMIRCCRSLAVLAVLSGLASAAPPKLAFRPGRVMPAAEVPRFTKTLIARERNFYRAGVGYDGKTGMTFDGHAIDANTGKL